MNIKQPDQTNPPDTPATNGVDAAASAMGAAMANRDAVLKSLAERRDQVFKLLEAQREEALKPMLRAKELLQQAQASVGISRHTGPALIQHDSSKDREQKPADSRERLSRTLTNGLTVLFSLQGAGGAAADAARDQATSEIVSALARLVEVEVDRLLHD